jgi:hypothetical protein
MTEDKASSPAARRLIEHLSHVGADWCAGQDRTIINQLFDGSHPPALLVELIRGLPLISRNETLGIRYVWLLEEVWRMAVRTEVWLLPSTDYTSALHVYTDMASREAIDVLGRAHILTDIVHRAAALKTTELRVAIGHLVEAVVSSEPNRFYPMLDVAEDWMKRAGLSRADIPTLRSMDAIAVKIQAEREALFDAAGPMLGPVLRQFLDGRIASYNSLQGQTRELDTLLAATKLERGAALTFLLDKMVVEGRCKTFSELALRSGRWAHEFNRNSQPEPDLHTLVFELAKRSHRLAEPDTTKVKLDTLKAAIEKEDPNPNWPRPLQAIRKALSDPHSVFKTDYETIRRRMTIHRNPLDWIYSEDNYYRFLSFDLILRLMLIGLGLTYLATVLLAVINHGMPTLPIAAVSAVVCYGLFLLLPEAASDLFGMQELPLPKPLIVIYLIVCLAGGALSLVGWQYFLPAMAQINGPVLVYSVAGILVAAAWMFAAFVISWFVIFPEY